MTSIYALAAFKGALLFHFLWALSRRWNRLTFDSPRIPRGKRRKVSIAQDADMTITVDVTSFQMVFHSFLSIFIVPYESSVVYIDRKLAPILYPDEAKRPDLLLSYQEIQHSEIHRKLNADLLKKSSLHVAFAVLCKHLTNALLPYHRIIAGMIAIFESIFYYQHEVRGLFNLFRDSTLMNEVFLWHYFEELEHHCESTFGFVEVYGWWRVLILPFSYAVFGCLVLTMAMFSAAYIVLNSPFLLKPILLLQVANGVAEFLATGALAVVFLMLNINSSDSSIREDLALYRRLYKQRFGRDLNETTIVLSGKSLPMKAKGNEGKQ